MSEPYDMTAYPEPVSERIDPAPEKAEANGTMAVTFSRPYRFEGEEYTGVNLAGLENLSANDLFEANRAMAMEYISPKPEADAKFCCIVAGLASGKPIQFFEGLPFKDALKVRNVVQDFFQDEA